MIVIETIPGDIARHLGLGRDAQDVFDARWPTCTGAGREAAAQRHPLPDGGGRQHPLAPAGCPLEQTASSYRKRQAEIAAGTPTVVIKRGMAITPVKFGISFTATLFNQAGRWCMCTPMAACW